MSKRFEQIAPGVAYNPDHGFAFKKVTDTNEVLLMRKRWLEAAAEGVANTGDLGAEAFMWLTPWALEKSDGVKVAIKQLGKVLQKAQSTGSLAWISTLAFCIHCLNMSRNKWSTSGEPELVAELAALVSEVDTVVAVFACDYLDQLKDEQ